MKFKREKVLRRMRLIARFSIIRVEKRLLNLVFRLLVV